MRICAIDVGSNSVRCLVADSIDGGRATVKQALRITRLGEGMGKRNEISEEAAGRTLAAIEEFASLGGGLGTERYIIFGTAMLREASNAGSFAKRVKETTGLDLRILSGEEEAALAFDGAMSSLPHDPHTTLVLDIGGGSLELMGRASTGSLTVKSLPLGCVRLTERFIASDPPSPAELLSLRDFVSLTLEREAAGFGSRYKTLLGTGGTVTTAASLSLGLARYEPARVHGTSLKADVIDEQIQRLTAIPLAKRRRLPSLEEKRADIIIAGLVTLREVLGFLRFDELTVSDEGVLRGVVLESLSLGSNL